MGSFSSGNNDIEKPSSFTTFDCYRACFIHVIVECVHYFVATFARNVSNSPNVSDMIK